MTKHVYSLFSDILRYLTKNDNYKTLGQNMHSSQKKDGGDVVSFSILDDQGRS
jgi:hypothetical protein